MTEPASDVPLPEVEVIHPPLRRTRFWPRLLAVLAAGVLLVRLSRFDGLLRPVEVVGSSMAGTLWGEHYQTECTACRIPTRIAKPKSEPIDRWRCGNCGREQAFVLTENSVTAPAKSQPLANPLSAKRVAGQRVFIDRAAFWFRPPGRDELVALRDAQGELRVKRIVGLPGEVMEIRDGDLWINGIRQQKSLTEYRQRALLVHDDHYRLGRSRWSSQSTNCQVTDHGFLFSPSSTEQVLVYQHQAQLLGGRWGPSPVLDDEPHNQHIHRRLFPCEDLSLVCQVVSERPVTFRVWFWTKSGPRVLRFEIPQGRSFWEAAWVDQRTWLFTSDQPELPTEALQAPDNFITAEEPLAIGVTSIGKVSLESLRVFRDLYLMGPALNAQPWTSPRLLAEEYFLLGDNVSTSRDSRHQLPGVKNRSEIIGRVYP